MPGIRSILRPKKTEQCLTDNLEKEIVYRANKNV